MENHLDLVRRGLTIKAHCGWQDFNDLTTATTPVDMPTAGTFYKLTNDGAGPFTNTKYKIYDHGLIWDTSSNQFDWSSLRLGDTVDMRLDYEITTASANTDVTTRLKMAAGDAGEYDLTFDERVFKSAGTHKIVLLFSVYMGDKTTLDNPAYFEVSADTNNAEVKVNGWYIRTLALR